MDDKEIIANYRRSAAITGMIVLGLKNFAASLIAHVRGGGTLDDAVLAQLREDCLIKAKNTDVVGLPIEHEANIIRQIVENLEKLIDHATAQGRQS